MNKALILLPVLGIAGFGAYMLLKPKGGATAAGAPKSKVGTLAALNQQYNQLEKKITSVTAQIASGVQQQLQNVPAATKKYCEDACSSAFLADTFCVPHCQHDHEKEYHNKAITWGTTQTQQVLEPLLNQQHQLQQQINGLTA